MKKLYSYLLIALAIPLILNSCKKDEESARDKFIGTWHVTENWAWPGEDTNTEVYDITITASSTNANVILISNFANVGVTVEANVVGNTMNIPTQSVSFEGSLISVSGSGNISGTTLTFSYSVSGGWSGTCNCTKR